MPLLFYTDDGISFRNVCDSQPNLANLICGINNIRELRRKNKAAVNLKTGRFDNTNSAVIISSVCKAVQNCKKSSLLSFIASNHAHVLYDLRKQRRFLTVLYRLAYTADDDS